MAKECGRKFKIGDLVVVIASETLIKAQIKYIGQSFKITRVLNNKSGGKTLYALDLIVPTFYTHELELDTKLHQVLS